MQEQQNLKALIREQPHGIIRFGTSAVLCVFVLLLIISTQIELIQTERADLDFQRINVSNADDIPVSFISNSAFALEKGDSVEVHLLQPGLEKVFTSEIVDIIEGKAWCNLAHSIQTAETNFALDCHPSGYVVFEAGKTTVFKKWTRSLFHSFNKQ